MSGGYQNLIVYQQAVLIFDLNDHFVKKYLDQFKDKRTIEQMQQASRSGKQNIVEGSLEKSSKLHINLTAVARASYGELLEDYKDYLRTRNLETWDKDDERLLPVRNMRVGANESNKSNGANWSNWTNDPERFANLMITFISKENYLLDKMVKSLEEKFVNEGGYTENLFKRRTEKRSNRSN